MGKGMANQDLWGAFISWLFSSKAIEISSDFHSRCAEVNRMLDNDVMGLVSTVLDYSINSASEAKFKIECSNENLENLLDIWLEKINININGVPTGLQELAKEYYKERWKGSSLCLLKVGGWKKIEQGKNSIDVPTILWFQNGSTTYIKRPNTKNYKLGTDKYFTDEEEKNEILINGKEQFIVQKPGSRWTTDYPSPYCVRKGILKNYLAMEVLQSKGDQIIAKVLPYVLQLTKGTEGTYVKKGKKPTTAELDTFKEAVKTALKRYNNEKGEVPLATSPYDEKFEHIIADILPMVREELFRQGTRNLLAGLGFVDMLEIASSRQETRLNPKPFIAEVNDGVDGFKSILKEVIYLIISKNEEYHKKFFSENVSLKIVNSPIRINIDQILDQLRSAYVYGVISVETYQEILNIDPSKELERMKKEWDNGLRELYYPHCISNQEDKGTDTVIPITKKQIEKIKEKETKPTTMTKSELEEDLEEAPYTMTDYPKYLNKYPKSAIEVWVKTFNDVLKKTGDEGKAFPIAWNQLKRFLKKNYIKQPDGTYKKKE